MVGQRVKPIVRPDAQDVWDYYDRRIVGRSGEWLKAECPLLAHDDRNPSASVNPETGKWQCWSCDGRGDTLDIIKENENLAGLADALEFAARNFAGSGGEVRGQRGSGRDLLGRSSAGARARNWQPPWGGL